MVRCAAHVRYDRSKWRLLRPLLTGQCLASKAESSITPSTDPFYSVALFPSLQNRSVLTGA